VTTTARFTLYSDMPRWLDAQVVELPCGVLVINHYPQDPPTNEKVIASVTAEAEVADEHEARRLVAGLVGPLFLAMSIDTGWPIDGEWLGGNGDFGGRHHVFGMSPTIRVRHTRRRPRPLSDYRDAAGRLAADEHLHLAARRLRAACSYLTTDEDAARALAFLAVETMVEWVIGAGATARTDELGVWKQAASGLGSDGRSIEQLWRSLQRGRHHSPAIADEKLGRLGLPALDAASCCDRVADLIDTLLSPPRPDAAVDPKQSMADV
jgi:hypothetical protein